MKGNQDADTTRATYFAGDAAMMIWSSFLLDELAGLRNDALPTCAAVQGRSHVAGEEHRHRHDAAGSERDGEPAAFGEIVSWAVLTDASDPRPRTSSAT